MIDSVKSYINLKNYRVKRAKRLREEKGFTLLEILIAISILAFGLLAVASMQSKAIQGNFFAGGKTEAVTWAQDRMETLMTLPYASVVSGGPITQGNYDISWTVTDDSPTTNCKLIVVTVAPQIRGVGQQVQLTCVKPQM